MQDEAQREQALRRLAEAGANPVVMTGFAFGDVLNKVAPDFPDTKFAIIDMVVEQPNVKSVVFNEHEGSYLVGMMAGLATKTGTVGFIGGMDIPLIRKFGCGYAQGVLAAKPDAKVVLNMTGTTPAAWNDPVKGAELAKGQKAQGADVIYAAAGGTGVGVLQAAADEGILSIGVDSNQNYLHPGAVLTSMLKRVDNAVYEAFKEGEALPPASTSWALRTTASAMRWTRTTPRSSRPRCRLRSMPRPRRSSRANWSCTTTCRTTPARPPRSDRRSLSGMMPRQISGAAFCKGSPRKPRHKRRAPWQTRGKTWPTRTGPKRLTPSS
jgi:hypothetical protein